MYQILWSQKSLSHGQLFSLMKCNTSFTGHQEIRLRAVYQSVLRITQILESSLTAQIQTWSEYKQRNTLKCLVGISPSGAFTFISKLWSGNVSDKELTKKCGILDLLEAGDDIMADRGFTIRDYCTERGCTLNIPPFSKGKPFSSKQVTKTRRIASSRIHVERAIERLKNFSFLQKVIPLKVKHTIDNVVMICAAICSLYPKLAK